MTSLCGVLYRKFDYSAYPGHVRYLGNYAFKPLIIAVSFNPTIFAHDKKPNFTSFAFTFTLTTFSLALVTQSQLPPWPPFPTRGGISPGIPSLGPPNILPPRPPPYTSPISPGIPNSSFSSTQLYSQPNSLANS